MIWGKQATYRDKSRLVVHVNPPAAEYVQKRACHRVQVFAAEDHLLHPHIAATKTLGHQRSLIRVIAASAKTEPLVRVQYRRLDFFQIRLAGQT